MKHNEYKSNKKSTRIISIIATAAVFAMVGFGFGMSTSHTNALAESETTAEEAQTIDYVSPAVAVYEKCADSVVGVITYTETWSRTSGEVQKTEVGEGSGVIISDEGYILTNNHVVADGSYYEVQLSNGERVPAELVGTDSGTDLAVLKVNDQTLTAIEIGSSAELKVGETVIAIGNPGGTVLANSVTQGIVSALERDMSQSFTRTVRTIQHDAAINPGNSGGALLNSKGQLVGINTLKLTGSAYSSTKYEGLGFAIPVDLAFPIAQQLIEYGEVRRPALGITCGTFNGPDDPISNYPPASVVISNVTENGPAAEAGIKAFDFITEVDGQRVKTLNELVQIMDQHAEGDTITVKVLRYDNTNAIIAILNSLNGNSSSDDFSSYFGSIYGFGGGYNTNARLTYQELTFDVTLRILANGTVAIETEKG